MTKFFITSTVICLTFLLCSCTSDQDKKQHQDVVKSEEKKASDIDTSQSIIQFAIKSSGLYLLDSASVTFDFRDKHYIYQRKNGVFRYERHFTNENGNNIKDILSNGGFSRNTNNDSTFVEEKKARAYSNSVNSVMYFAFLPLRLDDPAVETHYLS